MSVLPLDSRSLSYFASSLVSALYCNLCNSGVRSRVKELV